MGKADRMGIKTVLISILYFSNMVLFAESFMSTVVTNGLINVNRRNDACFDYPYSAPGMNAFSARQIENDELEESLFAAKRFFKFHYARYSSTNSLENWNLMGFIAMKDIRQFPNRPSTDKYILGYSPKEVDVVVFPFRVANVCSRNVLYCDLLRFYHRGDFLIALYYNSNTSSICPSFHDASGNENLVGNESEMPYIPLDEIEVQEQHLQWPDYFGSRKADDWIRAGMGFPYVCPTGDVKVIVDEL